MRLALEIVGLGALVVVVVTTVLLLRAWPIEASLKATTSSGAISVAAGVSLAGLSGSAAAIFNGPGVVAVHLRTRELWRRTIPRVSLDALLEWLAKPKQEKAEARSGFFWRRVTRAKDLLLQRTDLTALPDLGVRILSGLRDVSLRGGLLIGFSDPGHTGRAAALLYPIAGVLSPLGTIRLSFDWSGKNVLDGDAELSVRVIPARVLRETLRFARHHVSLRKPSPTIKEEEQLHGVLE